MACCIAALAAAPSALAAAADDEIALAQRYAPVVRLVEQPEECGPGDPYDPMDVDALFGEPTVALRGPWNAVDLIKVGPEAADLDGLYEYHLDFPGDALDPGCTYELWANRVTEGHEPTVYAHVATDPAHPGRLALQYWFFYAYNDWNNLHEGDWENVQLLFDAADARTALTQEPVSVGYSQHEGSERADWGDEKLKSSSTADQSCMPASWPPPRTLRRAAAFLRRLPPQGGWAAADHPGCPRTKLSSTATSWRSAATHDEARAAAH